MQKQTIYLMIIIAMMVVINVQIKAQNYHVTFKAEGAATTLDYVKVINLSSCGMVQLNGADTLLLEQPDYIGSINMNINNVQVYPNPMAGKCNLKYFSKSGDDLTISIYDLGMKLLISKEWKIEQGIHIFEINGLKSGVYILTVRNGKEIFPQRLVSTSALEGLVDVKYSSYESADIVNKSLKSLITLNYNTGDTILCEGYSGSLPTVLRTLIVNEDIEVKFNFKTQAIEGSDNICQGTQQTYSVESITGVMYTWSYSGSGFNIISGQGTSSIEAEFSDDATSANMIVIPKCSCGDLQSKTKIITVNPIPEITATADPSTMNSGDSSTLIASGANKYTWSTGDTTASITVSPTSTTTYTVTGTNSVECSNIATVSVTVNFTCSTNTVTYDGVIYNTVQIGTQCWMKENLRTTKYNDGSSINKITNNSTWTSTTSGAYCWYNNDSITYSSTYGALYNGYAVSTGKLCPSGWHVPSDGEWDTLTNYLKANSQYWCNSNFGYIAKSLANNSGWRTSSNTCAVGNNQSTNNVTGFSALPGGYRYDDAGSFNDIGNFGCWWSSTGFWNGACTRSLYHNDGTVRSTEYDNNIGISVRCLHD